jgi:hypothetical protein
MFHDVETTFNSSVYTCVDTGICENIEGFDRSVSVVTTLLQPCSEKGHMTIVRKWYTSDMAHPLVVGGEYLLPLDMEGSCYYTE